MINRLGIYKHSAEDYIEFFTKKIPRSLDPLFYQAPNLYINKYSLKKSIPFDFNKKLPFKDNSFNECHCGAIFLAKVPNLSFVINEIHRVMKDKAILRIIVPHFSSESAFAEPNHFFKYKTMLQSEELWKFIPIEKKLVFYKGKHIFGKFCEWIFNKYPYTYETTSLRNLFPAWLLYGVFRVEKSKELIDELKELYFLDNPSYRRLKEMIA